MKNVQHTRTKLRAVYRGTARKLFLISVFSLKLTKAPSFRQRFTFLVLMLELLKLGLFKMKISTMIVISVILNQNKIVFIIKNQDNSKLYKSNLNIKLMNNLFH